MNKKGFTVIELILSFAFVSVLTISMFSLLMNYRDKETEAFEMADINTFRNNITMMIQKDLQVHLLKDIQYCTSGTGIKNRCIVLSFQDGTSKEFRIAYKEETVHREADTFKYNRYFIVYGDYVYEAPSAGTVELRSDYMLEYSTKADSLENHLGLYHIRVGLYHTSLKINSAIDIVCVGNTKADTGVGQYKTYTIGQRVHVQVNSGENGNQYYFYVIKDSDSYDGYVTLIYDGVWPGGAQFFNKEDKYGNEFETSSINTALNTVYATWNNVYRRSDVRLLTANEATNLCNKGPVATYYDAASNIQMSCANYLKQHGSFWTSSPYLSRSSNNYAWFFKVDNNIAYLSKSPVSSSYALRPVIRIEKRFVLD